MASRLSRQIDPAPTASPSTFLPAADTSADRQRSRPAQAPWLSVIIVNYRQWDETEALVEQVLSHPDAQRGLVEVVVVDNASPTGPAYARLRRRDGVSVRCWKRNRGFAQAVNEGCRLSRGHWLLVMNPDISLRDRFLEGVLSLTERLPAIEPPVGIVGFKLLDRDGGWQRSTGEFPTLTGTIARLVLPRSRRKYNSPPNDRASRVPWVTGCCMLMRRECVEQLDGFDEDFFLYYEDVDLCRRASRVGWSVWYEPSHAVVHYSPLHGRAVPAPLRVLTRHAFLMYCFKHWSPWQVRFVARVVGFEATLRRYWASFRGRNAEAAQFRRLRRVAGRIAQFPFCSSINSQHRHFQPFFPRKKLQTLKFRRSPADKGHTACLVSRARRSPPIGTEDGTWSRLAPDRAGSTFCGCWFVVLPHQSGA